MVRMKVKVVGLDQHSMVPVVVITDHDEKGFIPILIGPVEAGAISTGLQGKKYERPMTHDLITDMIDKLGAKVERIVIHDLKNETYYARIELSTEDGEVDVDARPSDAIAIALRTDAPIFVSDKVAARALQVNQVDEDDEMADFRRFLEDVTPEDFKRFNENFKKD